MQRQTLQTGDSLSDCTFVIDVLTVKRPDWRSPVCLPCGQIITFLSRLSVVVFNADLTPRGNSAIGKSSSLDNVASSRLAVWKVDCNKWRPRLRQVRMGIDSI